jgi:hypothetical protein
MILSNLFYIVAFILLGCWVLGFLVYNIGSFVHLLLIAAVLLVAIRVLKGKKVFSK